MHSTPDPSRVRFTGPLASFAPGLAEELVAQGYTRTSAVTQLQLTAHLSRWLGAGGMGPADLNGPVVERFLAVRRDRFTSHYSLSALDLILGYLRRAGAAPVPVPVPPSTAAEVLLAQFAAYLTGERAVTGPVARAYCHWVRPFAEAAFRAGDHRRELAAGDVTRFLTERLPGMSRKSAQMTACSLRSFLRFLHAEGIVDAGLASAVPPVAYWRLSGLPKALDAGQIQRLRAAWNTSDPVGRRDLAVITLMHRMGLRCTEVAALRLEDVDWSSGSVTIHGKGNRTDQLPLPADIGEAVVDYLRCGRPATSARTVFVRATAPFTALERSSISCIVARAASRAGLGIIHGHRLRHTAATGTLNAGASLEEVAQLMRHAGAATTVIYAKTDQARLARLARPWPVAGDAR